MVLGFCYCFWASIVGKLSDLPQFNPVNKGQVHGGMFGLVVFVVGFQGFFLVYRIIGYWIVGGDNGLKFIFVGDWAVCVVETEILREFTINRVGRKEGDEDSFFM